MTSPHAKERPDGNRSAPDSQTALQRLIDSEPTATWPVATGHDGVPMASGTPESLAAFVSRQRANRAAAGLPGTITDVDTLRVVAALVAEGVRCDRNAA